MFADNDFDLDRTGVVNHNINTGDSRPIKHQKRVPDERRLRQNIDDMLVRVAIKPSNSPWSLPIIRVKKVDGIV